MDMNTLEKRLGFYISSRSRWMRALPDVKPQVGSAGLDSMESIWSGWGDTVGMVWIVGQELGSERILLDARKIEKE